jgi:hypothetical protein
VGPDHGSPCLGRLLWASNSTRPHHMDGSGAATWPEKMIYSKVSTVSSDPHGNVPNPYIYRSSLRVRSRRPGPPRAQTGPLGWVPDPSVWGTGHSQQGPGVLGQRIPRP